jgi:predicted RNA-binding protein with PIN domain
MHYLIDGHNLIAKLPDISLDDPEDEAKLVLRLRSWAAASRKRRITVVFDQGLPGGEARRLSTGSVKVLFASAGRTADSILVSRIQRVRDASAYTLVSSDRFVRAAATARQMPQLSAEDFAGKLSHVGHDSDSAKIRRERELNDEEVAEWLQIFGRSDDV